MIEALKRIDLIDIIINIMAGAIVTLGTLVFSRLFPGLNSNLLSLIASIVAIFVLCIIHYFRIRGFFTSEPVLLPLMFTMITILAIWVLVPSIVEPVIGRSPGKPESFSVYPNYDPSGYMGDTGDIVNVNKDPEGVRFTYEARGRGTHEWQWKYINGVLNPNPARFAGVMYLCPPNNWGQEPGFNLRAFRRAIAWEARSLSDEVNVEFVIGGINWVWDEEKEVKVSPPCPDSLRRKSLGIYTLTEQWQSFEVELPDIPKEEFVNVIGGFAWLITWGSNEIQPNETGTGPKEPRTFVIEICNIRYER